MCSHTNLPLHTTHIKFFVRILPTLLCALKIPHNRKPKPSLFNFNIFLALNVFRCVACETFSWADPLNSEASTSICSIFHWITLVLCHVFIPLGIEAFLTRHGMITLARTKNIASFIRVLHFVPSFSTVGLQLTRPTIFSICTALCVTIFSAPKLQNFLITACSMTFCSQLPAIPSLEELELW